MQHIKKIWNKITSDPSGIFFSIWDRKILGIDKFYSTIRMRFILKLRGVRLGKHCTFYGKTIFRRYVESTIFIGDQCRFRSSFLSNNVGLNRHCFLSTLRKEASLIIGNNVGMSGTVIGCANSIKIGNNVLLGGNTFITDTDWHSVNRSSDKSATSKPVVIEDNVFIGTSAIILKGTRIGKGSVIGANSVVSGEIPEGVIAAGNPCRVIKQIV